jgi:hypothetical protein
VRDSQSLWGLLVEGIAWRSTVSPTRCLLGRMSGSQHGQEN